MPEQILGENSMLRSTVHAAQVVGNEAWTFCSRRLRGLDISYIYVNTQSVVLPAAISCYQCRWVFGGGTGHHPPTKSSAELAEMPYLTCRCGRRIHLEHPWVAGWIAAIEYVRELTTPDADEIAREMNTRLEDLCPCTPEAPFHWHLKDGYAHQ